MASTLVTTKLSAPRLRGALVPRPRLTALMDAGAEATLTLVSAPAGFGKTTVLASWLARASTEPRTVAFVSLDESDSHAGLVLALRRHGAGLGRARRRRERPAAAGRGAARDPHAADRGPQRGRGPPERGGPDPRRLPPRGRPRGGRGDDLPARAPAAEPARRGQHPRRPQPPAGAAARARRARRDPRPRPPLHRRRDRLLPHRRRRPARRAGGGVGPRVPDRGVGGSAAAGIPVDAGPGRRRRLHRRVRRDRSLRRRLPRGRGAVPAVRRGPRLPGADVDPRPARRGPVRRRPRTDRQPGDAREAGAREPVPRAAGRPAQLVPLPPPVRRRPPGAPSQRATRPRPGTPPARQPLVRRGRRARPRGAPRARRRRRSTGLPISSRRPPPPCGATGRRPRSGAGSTTCPTRSSSDARSSPSPSSAP